MANARKSTVKPVIAGPDTRLDKVDPASTCGFAGDKASSEALRAGHIARLAQLQDVLYAQQKHPVLVVFQAMDTGGKDGVVRYVFSGLNPQGVHVKSFKAPSEEELSHDYLWRIHPFAPAKGRIAVFNRSHYEDVVITRVHGWISAAQCKRRYRHINDFERMLVEEGTTIVKFFLHISRDEQRKRLQARLDAPDKRWKFNPADLAEREHWDDYMAAYQDALRATSQDRAPWYIVPSDKKWLRDLYVAKVLVDTLEALDLRYPDPPPGLDKLVVR